MIDELTASIQFQGDSFSPKRAEELTGLILSNTNEPGDLGTIGKFKNQPTPYGSASLKAPDEIDQFKQILWLAKAVTGKLDVFLECGADIPHFYIGFFYKDQCNYEDRATFLL